MTAGQMVALGAVVVLAMIAGAWIYRVAHRDAQDRIAGRPPKRNGLNVAPAPARKADVIPFPARTDRGDTQGPTLA